MDRDTLHLALGWEAAAGRPGWGVRNSEWERLWTNINRPPEDACAARLPCEPVAGSPASPGAHSVVLPAAQAAPAGGRPPVSPAPGGVCPSLLCRLSGPGPGASSALGKTSRLPTGGPWRRDGPRGQRRPCPCPGFCRDRVSTAFSSSGLLLGPLGG